MGDSQGRLIDNITYITKEQATRAFTVWNQVKLVDYVRQTGKANVYGARVVIPSKWNLSLLWSMAELTSDREVVQFLTFGWPLNHNGNPVMVSTFNHSSAVRHSAQVDKYVARELEYGCLLGPFLQIPWTTGLVGVSPMSTRLKWDSQKRRIIMDMSWPHNGE